MKFDTIIIGAGQAGLSAGYFLKQAGKHFLILDQAKEIGGSWESRYDSLKLFTPAEYNNLPGLPFPFEKGRYPSKVHVGEYLKQYAKANNLPVSLGEKVVTLSRNEDGFSISTNQKNYTSTNVIVATGPFQTPYIPKISHHQSEQIVQSHSSNYRNPGQLPPGAVLVVGGGNSAAQIAVELSQVKTTYISVRSPLNFKSLEIFGKSIFWWGSLFGVFTAPPNSWIGRRLKTNEGIYGLELKALLKNGKVKLHKELQSISGNKVKFKDGKESEVSAIIWATGFRNNYSWINIPEVFLENNTIKHREGITQVKGLYFLGLSWQRSRSSALIMGAGRDALFIFNHLNSKR